MTLSLSQKIDTHVGDLSPAELRVGRYLASNREEALIASAAEIARKTDTSDATVVRTARALGYGGLAALRRDLADELRDGPTPADRLSKTLERIDGDIAKAYSSTIDIHLKSLKSLRQGANREPFRAALEYLVQADRIAVFGMGPSSAMATYFVIQLRRFGVDAFALTDSGLLLADGLLRLRRGDVLFVMAYGRVYAELLAMFDRADQVGIKRVLISDALGSILKKRIDLVLQVPRGRTKAFSMHTATIAFLEALLVGVATCRPKETTESLTTFTQLRARVTGKAYNL